MNFVRAVISLSKSPNLRNSHQRTQETFSLAHTRDGFRKIVVTGDPYEKPWMDDSGITFMGIVQFLLHPRSIELL